MDAHDPPRGTSSEELPVQSFDGAWLSGTLTLPGRPRAITITVHGSLLQDRNGDLDGRRAWMFPGVVPIRNLFGDLRQAVLAVDVGTYCYDKRASGNSEGVFAQTTLTMLARDVIEVASALRRLHPGIPIGVAAQSEGGYTCLRAVELGFAPDFMILQGAPLEPLERSIEFQRTRAAKPFLEDSDGELASRYPFISALYQATYRGDLLDAVRSGAREYELRNGSWRCRIGLELYREYDMDAVALLGQTRCPVLVVNGAEDGNVSPEPARRIRDAYGSGKLDHVEVSVLPGLGHSFRRVAPGESFIDAMAKPVDPTYLDQVRTFLDAVLHDLSVDSPRQASG